MNNQQLEVKVKTVSGSLLYKKGYVCSVDVLMGLGCLSAKDYDNWRFGRVEYLERACQANLKKLSLINKSIRKFAVQQQLKPSWTAYMKYGKGPKKHLQFSKSGDDNIEKAYATHFVKFKDQSQKEKGKEAE